MKVANAAAVLFTNFRKLGKHLHQAVAAVVATKAASFALFSRLGFVPQYTEFECRCGRGIADNSDIAG